jgi:methyltransferase (TIGR00027 family)
MYDASPLVYFRSDSGVYPNRINTLVCLYCEAAIEVRSAQDMSKGKDNKHMQADRASETAIISAVMRSAHPLLDEAPWIFVDDMGASFGGLKDQAALRAWLSSYEEQLIAISGPALAKVFMRTGRLCGAFRARVAEDVLAEAMRRGVSQYVLLGAGFDSFAYCRHDPTSGLRVYEVDHPATQREKIARLRQLGASIPASTTFVTMDFLKDELLDTLCKHGFQREQPAVFCWLGVTWYLSDESIDRVLRDVASAAPGSELVVDYILTDRFLDDEQRDLLRTLERMASSFGEPGGNCFDPARMAERLKAHNFSVLMDIGAEAGNARYLGGRSDGLRIPEFLHVTSARVAPP